jgi:hypothetical protein
MECDGEIGSKTEELYLVVTEKRGDVGVVAGESCLVDERREEMKRKGMMLLDERREEMKRKGTMRCSSS